MADKLTFAELTSQIAIETQLEPRDVQALLRELSQVVSHGLVRDGHVRIGRLGLFKLRRAKGRMGRNPKTGEPIEIANRCRVVFVPQRTLRQAVNKEFEHLTYEPLDAVDEASRAIDVEGEYAPEEIRVETRARGGSLAEAFATRRGRGWLSGI